MKKMIDVGKLHRAIARKQATIDRNSRAMRRAPKFVVVGWDSHSGTYPEQDGKPVSYIAQIHEYGLGNNTEKAMVRNTEYEHSKEWAQLFMKLVKKQSRGRKTPDYFDIFEQIGKRVKRDLRDYLYAIDLIDTTRLAESIIINYRRNN